MTTNKIWHETLPKKRMGAGALFLDEAGRLLLVNPTYKPQWEIPGGVVEQDESPRQACVREVQEEIGLTKPIERLLSISYKASHANRTEALMFIFWGGVLTPDDIAAIRLPTTELSEYRFVTLAEALTLLTPALGERVRQSLEILPTERTLYLET
ncbi:MAG: NUDIX hydrolase [Caldilineaceae bacterium]